MKPTGSIGIDMRDEPAQSISVVDETDDGARKVFVMLEPV